jgi:hypothetical protein
VVSKGSRAKHQRQGGWEEEQYECDELGDFVRTSILVLIHININVCGGPDRDG